MEPELHEGEYVFCTTADASGIDVSAIVMLFKEEEGETLILKKELADHNGLEYGFIASWITLRVHSALEAVGLTAAFSKALTDANISCNVVAGYYHDHIFVDKKDAESAMVVLHRFGSSN